MLIWSFAAGVLDAFVPDNGAVVLVLTFACAVLILLWCHYDAAERSYQIKLPLSILIFALALVGVPLYFMITRRWRAIFSIALTILFLAVLGMGAGLGILATYLVTGKLPIGI